LLTSINFVLWAGNAHVDGVLIWKGFRAPTVAESHATPRLMESWTVRRDAPPAGKAEAGSEPQREDGADG